MLRSIKIADEVGVSEAPHEGSFLDWVAARLSPSGRMGQAGRGGAVHTIICPDGRADSEPDKLPLRPTSRRMDWDAHKNAERRQRTY